MRSFRPMFVDRPLPDTSDAVGVVLAVADVSSVGAVAALIVDTVYPHLAVYDFVVVAGVYVGGVAIVTVVADVALAGVAVAAIAAGVASALVAAYCCYCARC